MARERPREAARLCLNFAAAEPSWQPDPDPESVHQAAMEWVSHQVASYLRSHGVLAKRLSDELGDTQTSWRNKLSGYRLFRLSDIVAIALAIDIGVLEAIPAGADDIRELLPPAYQELLTHHQPGIGMPRFKARTVNWSAGAAAVAGWLKGEEDSGRGWLISREVMLQRIVASLHDAGLSSTLAAPAGPDARDDVIWVASSVRLCFLWLGRSTQPTAAQVTSGLASIARHLWRLAHSPGFDHSVLVVTAPPSMLANFQRVSGLDDEERHSVTLSLQHAARLGLTGVDHSMPDVEIALLCSAADSGSDALWLTIKA